MNDYFPLFDVLGVSADQDLGYGWYQDSQWTKEEIEKRRNATLAKHWAQVGGVYGEHETRVLYETLNLHRKEIKGKSVLVVGSESPWVEAVILAVGAKHITTLDYNKIRPSHPQVIKGFLCLISISHDFMERVLYFGCIFVRVDP